jgi:hypothetical protein
MFNLLFGTRSAPRNINFELVVSFSDEPSNRVHDLHGDWDIEDGDTIENAPYKIVAQYKKENGISSRGDIQILKWRYW